ncbi:MAG: ASKHA domain-containing protein, partial [Christensenella sp.]
MCDIGVIDETGRIDDESGSRFVGEIEGEPIILIAENVFITQKDIRELQTAKAAVAAGVLSLVKEANMSISDIKRVYIAGGFGNYMNQRSATRIGLLSDDFNEIVSVGNAAGAGASMALFNAQYEADMKHICAVGKHVELGSNPYFMEKYVDSMYF